MNKKIKCEKCGLYYKPRDEDMDKQQDMVSTLCFNCAFVWKMLGLVVKSFPPKLNRGIEIRLESVRIYKTK